MRTLDRSRPFAEVFGEATYRYEQDHIQFDQFGREVGAKKAASTVTAAPAGPVATINGTQWELGGLTRDELLEVARSAGLNPHPQTGAKKLIEAIMAVSKQAAETGTSGNPQLDAQLAG